ncbi:MAG: tetratricopeptide repeat protein [Planctomycetes bacterium]|nr:tetratricopeptide repeat protein [Planctomycetota bacterium]
MACYSVGRAETWTMVAPLLRARPLSKFEATSNEAKTNEAKARFVSLPPGQTGVDFTNRLDWNHPRGLLFHGGFACGGIAVGDVDSNGLPDLFFVGGSGRNRLYLQQSPWKFEERAVVAGLVGDAWGTGATFFDIDNDGDLDLYVCNYDAPNSLYINRGDGTFDERASEYGLDIVDACLMPSVADYDRDGDLDIYLAVNRYMDEKQFRRSDLFYQQEGMEYLRPSAEKYFTIRRHFARAEQLNMWAGRKDRLLRNEGPTKKFVDVSEQMGLERGDTLSATWWDYNHDDWPDLYVANDLAAPDRLFHNNRDGSFTDVALKNLPHTPWLAMGSSAGDINNDGLVDLLVADMSFRTHFKDKVFMGDMSSKFRNADFFPHTQLMRNALFVNTGTEHFQEAAHLAGLASTDWTWSAKLADLDNDGRIDAFFTNGSPINLSGSAEIETFADVSELGDSETIDTSLLRKRYRKLPPVLEQSLAYQNRGDLHFVDRSKAWGLDNVGMSFGAVHADLDRDGDLDLVVANLDHPPLFYRNDTQESGVLVQLQGTRSNRFGVGAELTLETEQGRQVRQIFPVAGFQSCQEASVHFGIGSANKIQKLSVRWPSGAQQTFENLESGQIFLVTEPETEPVAKMQAAPLPAPLFLPLADAIVAEHHEQPFDDFARQPLLPNKLSQLGPPMAWGDVDGDGDDDLFLGEGTDWMGMLYLNRAELKQSNLPFEPQPQVSLARDAVAEDRTATFFDANGDGHLDLYVGSGSVEREVGDERLRDRLYFGDGAGNLEAASEGWLPDLRNSTGAVAAHDFDHDGDIDLVVGSRSIPGEYPLAPEHALLRNEGDHFANVLDQIAPELAEAGMITAAVWADMDGDGWDDLLVAIDWGTVRLFMNQRGKLVEATAAAGLNQWTGWWQSLVCADLDGDGDVDLVAGNFGLNTKYKASPASPVLAYFGEYSDTGQRNFIEASYEDEVLFPMRGKSCSSSAMPHLTKRFSTYEQFAKATLSDIYTPRCLQQAERFEVNTLASVCFLNDGAGRFEMVPLPTAAQLAPVFAIAVTEVNGDGVPDLFLGQNFSGPQRETGPMAGGLGVVAIGRGDGTFETLRPDQAGVVVPGDAMAVAAIDLDGDGWRDLCVATNNGPLRVFRHRKTPSPSPSLENGGGGFGISLSSKSATNWSQHNLALARQFIDSDQSQQSLPYLRRALKAAPRNPEGLLLLAIVRRDQGRFDEAMGLLDRLRDRKGVDLFRLAIEEGRLFYSLKQFDRAAEILQQVVIASPSDQQAHLALAYVCLKQGRFEEAREHFLLAGARGGEDAKREEAGEPR